MTEKRLGSPLGGLSLAALCGMAFWVVSQVTVLGQSPRESGARPAPRNRGSVYRKPAAAPRIDREIQPVVYPAESSESAVGEIAGGDIAGGDIAGGEIAATTGSREAAAETGANLIASLTEAQPGEHPLMPALRWAKMGHQQLSEDVRDYSCTLVKRERIDGELGEHQYMFVKVRHAPFSVYTYFLKPKKVKGQEAIYVEGSNEGKLLAHGVGLQAVIGTLSLDPESTLARRDNRYPITELGIRRLTERLIEVAEHDTQFGECEVKLNRKAKVNKRPCICIEVKHPVPRREFLFNMARIYVDNEYNLPTRYESYEWPQDPQGDPVLVEEYTYVDLKFNNGFTDRDFDIRNESYGYKE